MNNQKVQVEETERLVIWTRNTEGGNMDFTIYDKQTTGLETGRMHPESVKRAVESAKRIRK